MSSNSRRVSSTDAPPTKAWNWSARISTSPIITGACSLRTSARLRRRTTASMRAISSSGWHGLVTQSSAPSRSPRTRWATEDCPVQTITPSPGRRAQSLSRYVQPCGPSTARSTTTAFSRSATIASSGTGEASTRCCQPMPSSRLPRTCRKPVSESITARRTAACPAAPVRRSSTTIVVISRRTLLTKEHWFDPPNVLVTTYSQAGNQIDGGRSGNVRRVRELSELARDHERDLLADVDGVVADPLYGAGHEHHRHRPLAAIGVGADLDGAGEDAAIEAVDLLVLADEILRDRNISQQERLLGLLDLRPGELAHAEDVLEHRLVLRRVVADHRQHLGDVDALVAHALDVLDHVQQRGDHAQVRGDGRLQRQQRQDALLDLEIAPVDAVVVEDDDRGELDVLVLQGLQR